MKRERAAASVVACKICGQGHVLRGLEAGTRALCVRCGSTVATPAGQSLQRTAALALAALILYIPANVFPIMQMEVYGAASENTVWEGCVRLFEDHQWVIAIIVFLASILIPFLKLAGLFMLVITTRLGAARGRVWRTWLLRLIEGVGRWAMLDVFVMAILVSLVKLQRLATIIAGPGLFAFCCVVVLTLLASASFDARNIWNDGEEKP